jgi:hypothetical protein
VANACKSKVRSAVERVFAYQKGPMVLIVKQCRGVERVAPIGRGKPPFQDHDFPAVTNASAVLTLGVKVWLIY